MKVIIIFISLLISFLYCKGQERVMQHSKNEKINIKELEIIRDSLKGNKKSLESNINGKKTKSFLVAGDLFYSEETIEKTINISGNEYNGYLRKEKRADSNIELLNEFYPNGNIKRSGQIRYNANKEDNPIGIWQLYDESRMLIETREYNYDEKLFIFREEDIKTYIKNMDNKIFQNNEYKYTKLPQLKINNEITQKASWLIQIFEGLTIRRITIDAQTGNVLNETISSIEK